MAFLLLHNYTDFIRISINKRQHNIKVENTRLDNHRIPTKKDNAI